MIIVITPTNFQCSRVERNRFGQMKRLLRTVFAFAITGRHETFFGDEAHFKLNGSVNKQNICNWPADNPNWHITKSLYTEWVTVKNVHTVSIYSVWFEEILKTFFFFFFFWNRRDVELSQNKLGFNRAPHISNSVIQCLKKKTWWSFHRIVCCSLWPPQSPDPTSCNFFLRHLKVNMFSTYS